jgi:hypothetical protein
MDTGIWLPGNAALLARGFTNCLPLAVDVQVGPAIALKSPVSIAAVGMNVVLEGGFERFRVP